MSKSTKKFKKQKIIILLVMVVVSFIVVLDWFVEINWYFPIRVHEFGHKVVLENKQGVESCYYTRTNESYRTNCIHEKGSLSEFDKDLFSISGYGMEFLVALLVMITPLSLIGGVWMLKIQTSILLHNNNIGNDFYWLSFGWKLFIAFLLALMFILALIIQNKWIDYFLKRKRKN